MKRFLLISLCLVVFCCAVSAQKTTGRVHAVIISGGMNKLMNHERYWNDCAFLYRTLRNDYHFAKQDITLLISDGGEADRDMLLADGSGFASSSADLDSDGERDVWLPATLQQVTATLSELAGRLTTSDRLFLFIIDHGGFDDGQHESFAWLWGGERLYVSRLAQLLDNFHVASMSMVMGMCHSGGFADGLRGDKRIIATSCAVHEESWACHDRPYDEFVYQWTCAVASHDIDGHAINADTDGDGFVSMSEAFSYAYQHDRREETPQYSSTPTTLGEQWVLSPKPLNGIGVAVAGQETLYRCYDQQGRRMPTLSTAAVKHLKNLNTKQSFRPSAIIIIKP